MSDLARLHKQAELLQETIAGGAKDRLVSHEPKGRGFESLRARHARILEIVAVSGIRVFCVSVADHFCGCDGRFAVV